MRNASQCLCSILAVLALAGCVTQVMLSPQKKAEACMNKAVEAHKPAEANFLPLHQVGNSMIASGEFVYQKDRTFSYGLTAWIDETQGKDVVFQSARYEDPKNPTNETYTSASVTASLNNPALVTHMYSVQNDTVDNSGIGSKTSRETRVQAQTDAVNAYLAFRDCMMDDKK